jgi:oxygen-dependent protoporphyrinogen oxidase
VVLAEAADVLGGNILTRSEGGFTWEDGPNTFQPGDVMLDFLAEIGLQSKLVSSDPKLSRYVYYNGEMFSLPSGGGPPKDLVRLLSPLGLVRAAAGALLPTAASAEDETIAAFFERTLGPEVSPAPCPLPWTLEPLPPHRLLARRLRPTGRRRGRAEG